MMKEYINKKENYSLKKDMSDYELMQFIESIEENSLIKAPAHMKEEIMQKSKNPMVQITVETKRVSKKLQLFLYGLKVSAVAAAALTLLVVSSIPMNNATEPKPREPEKRQEFNITESLLNGSNKVTGFLGNVADKMILDDYGRGERK